MTRIRLALVVLALGLGIPVAVLAWRALDGLELERAVRHQALAERAFDEMERSLSTWLEREESRPFEQYRFYVAPDRRSPLADGASEDFVVGAFQVDPDGSVNTPMQPRDLKAATARGHWPPPESVQQAIAQVTRVVRDTWKQDAAGRRLDAPERRSELETGKRQDPGTTRPLDGPLAGKALAKATQADDAKDEGANVYDAIQRFNRGADSRAQRKQKIAAARLPPRSKSPSRVAPAPTPAAEPYAAAESYGFESARERAGVLAESGLADATRGAQAGDLAEVPPGEVATQELRSLGYVVSEVLREESEGAASSAPVVVAGAKEALSPAVLEQEQDSEQLRLALDPMAGRATADGQLLLYRTVLVGQQGFRQGLLLDRGKLGAWLTASALEPAGLSRVASVRFASDAVPEGDAAFVFQHRFAEPFDALTAQLSLAALPGVGRPGAIYGLVALLALVGVAGLFAIHRMVGVAVHFAERRSNFVSAVTHELKTPLTAIRMYGEMLRDGLVAGEAKKTEYYATITDESERLSRLIDNVLEFSRLERGTREMNWSVGPIAPVVREAADKLRAHAEHEGFSLEVEIEPDLPPVRYDRDALLQVLFNLVDNAMKYASTASERRVVLEARRRNGGVELAVRDFGPGVSGRHLSRIFEPFYRGEDELTRSAKGTGIGLALVRDLSERMGAGVRGANVPGGGFRVCLAFAAEGS